MDPALQELIDQTPPGAEAKVILKLRHAHSPPSGIRIVTQFDRIATARIPKERIREVWASDAVESVKAPRLVDNEMVPGLVSAEAAPAEGWSDSRFRIARPLTGQGTVVAVLDWGCDFAHPNFRRADGATRLLALWDQAASPGVDVDNRWGYGQIHTREAIDQALQACDPYAALGYHPAPSEIPGGGTHGTSVLDIAAGNGRTPGSPTGIAPEAELIFVHMSSGGISGLADLGDSVHLLEGLDFVAQTAADRPWVANLSLGRMGGSHTGNSLVEQGMDALLMAAPGRAIVQSTGNYFSIDAHASGRLLPAGEHRLGWVVAPTDVTPNELEIWYPRCDHFQVSITPPREQQPFVARCDERTAITVNGQQVGRLYHRAHDPTNGDNHIDIFLDREAPPGEWQIMLYGEDISDGRFHAWIERDVNVRNQSHFAQADVQARFTTGTIANGYRTIAVGAFDPSASDRDIGGFSSSGPTRDGRFKPDLLAPGQHILTACSTPEQAPPGSAEPVDRTGTSFAAPHVTGTVALMFQAAAPSKLTVADTRARC